MTRTRTPKPKPPRPVVLWVDHFGLAHWFEDETPRPGHGWRRVRYVPSHRGTAAALKVAVRALRRGERLCRVCYCVCSKEKKNVMGDALASIRKLTGGRPTTDPETICKCGHARKWHIRSSYSGLMCNLVSCKFGGGGCKAFRAKEGRR